MTRAEEASIAYQLVAHGPRVMGGDAVLSDDDFKFWNINYDFVAGYKQAEKDLALTTDDVWRIFNLVRELQTKYSATDGCLQEVADIFNEQRQK